jgi:hypothetical protein
MCQRGRLLVRLRRLLALLQLRLSQRHVWGVDLVEEEFEDTWAIWMAEEGLELEDQIHHELLANRHLMDINDGTHGTWVDGTLGVLMVFDDDEIREFLDAWQDSRKGNLMSLTSIMQWLEHLSSFLQDCVDAHDNLNE